MEKLVEQFKKGSISALSRLITLAEDDSPLSDEIMEAIYPLTGRAYIIGVTGPPGAGKSTLVDKLIGTYRQHGFSVGVLCIDPSSIYSGGAFLGDRIRMDRAYEDQEVYLRSLATRGELGGLAPRIREVIKILDAFGKDVIIIETVGVGQMEADIIHYADTKIVLSVPGLGDQIQALKAGIVEIADIFVVNKADIAGAADTANDLKVMLQLKRKQSRKPEIIMTEALNNKGITELYEAIQRHKEYLEESGLNILRMKEDLVYTCRHLAIKMLQAILTRKTKEEGEIKEIMGKVEQGDLNPYRGANQIVNILLNKLPGVK